MSFNKFNLPPEIGPIPSLSAEEEESFVILEKTFGSHNSQCEVTSMDLPDQKLLDERRKLIDLELERLQISSSQPKKIQGSDQFDSITTIGSELSPDEVQQKVDAIINENTKLRETLLKNNTAMQAQRERILSWKEEIQKIHQTHKLKFNEAKELISKLRKENEGLSRDVEKVLEIKQMHENEIFDLKDQLRDITKQLGARNPENDFKSFVDLGKLSLNSAPQSETIQQLMLQMNEKDDEIKKSENIINELSKSIDTLNLARAEKESQIQDISIQLNKAQVRITSMEQHNKQATKELMNLREDLEREKENSKINIELSKHQLEVYKADFEAEKRAKEKLQEERAQIINDFLEVQKRNTELLEEVELLKERGFEVVGRNHVSNSSSGSSSPESPVPNQYECPICNLKYRSLKFLEEHVETCIPEPSWL